MQFEFQSPPQLFERVKYLVRAVIPFFAIFAQRFADDLLKLGRRVREITRERRRLFIKNRRHHLLWPRLQRPACIACIAGRCSTAGRCVTGEWRMPGYHFIKHHPETPDVGPFINLLAARLLR